MSTRRVSAAGTKTGVIAGGVVFAIVLVAGIAAGETAPPPGSPYDNASVQPTDERQGELPEPATPGKWVTCPSGEEVWVEDRALKNLHQFPRQMKVGIGNERGYGFADRDLLIGPCATGAEPVPVLDPDSGEPIGSVSPGDPAGARLSRNG